MSYESRGLRLDGDVAIITGGGQGIGEATSRLFAERGAIVIIGDQNELQGKQVAADIIDSGGEAFAFRTDVTDKSNLDDLVAFAMEQAGKINALVNNAGVAIDGLLFKQPDEDFERVIEVNLFGARHLAKRVANAMGRSGIRGSISNASSASAEYGLAGQTAYGASKGAIEVFTMAMASELGSRGIRVNAVAPGPTDTRMLGQVPAAQLEVFEQKTMLGRKADPIEIARAYGWLASDEASYVTGSILTVSGGYRG